MSEGVDLIQIFARAPVLGQTKRRLASELGEGAALHWYRVLLARTLATVRQLPDVVIEVWHPAEDDDYPLMELINDASVGLYPQASGDLGQKMSNALEVGLTRSERVLLIGADCPVWTTSLLRQAMDGISSASALFVPAADGPSFKEVSISFIIGVESTWILPFESIQIGTFFHSGALGNFLLFIGFI